MRSVGTWVRLRQCSGQQEYLSDKLKELLAKEADHLVHGHPR
jgi:hypothetical protein